MAKRKSRSPAESTAQKKRTHINLKKKYEDLCERFPDSKHNRKWQELIEFYSKN